MLKIVRTEDTPEGPLLPCSVRRGVTFLCRRGRIGERCKLNSRHVNLKPDTDRHLSCTRSTSVDVCLTPFGVGPLVFARGSMNTEAYGNILDNEMLPTLWCFYGMDSCYFQDDNARCHVSIATMQWYPVNNVRRMDWPAQSPDLNPIEHLWDELDRRVRARQARPKSIAQLMEWLQEEWRGIPVDVLQTLLESMPDSAADAAVTEASHFHPFAHRVFCSVRWADPSPPPPPWHSALPYFPLHWISSSSPRYPTTAPPGEPFKDFLTRHLLRPLPKTPPPTRFLPHVSTLPPPPPPPLTQYPRGAEIPPLIFPDKTTPTQITGRQKKRQEDEERKGEALNSSTKVAVHLQDGHVSEIASDPDDSILPSILISAVPEPAHLPRRRTGFNPGLVTPGFSHMGIVPDDTAGGGFSRGSPVSSAPSFRHWATLISITLTGSQVLAVHSCPEFFTHSLYIFAQLYGDREHGRARTSSGEIRFHRLCSARAMITFSLGRRPERTCVLTCVAAIRCRPVCNQLTRRWHEVQSYRTSIRA
ncbi:hypothetical protein PR048_000799 [Dryococelus australis]|uniref:Tc1-like transposase DDE domain-containing protein n=1 Tax=Dryococelus australis TaxID=614101 RepID=A0ABQ9IFN4_9NEOP|nr:hypothetical protein PR048_000799 [Dryococelus australis]